MGTFGIGTETYLYINGLSVNNEIQLGENRILMPVQGKLSVNTLKNTINSDTDFAITILCARSITSQLKITAEIPEDLAISAWNAQWDLILLSAIFRCDSMCNLQCTEPLDMISDGSILQVTNYHMRALFSKPYIISKEDEEWINRHYINAQALLDNDPFNTAVHSLATYKWHSLPRVQLAILWAGIEALFGVNNELSFRISLYISKFLGDNKEKIRELFADAKSLYNARSSAVHGSKIKGEINSLVEKSAFLLNGLIRKCIVINALPNIDELIY